MNDEIGGSTSTGKTNEQLQSDLVEMISHGFVDVRDRYIQNICRAEAPKMKVLRWSVFFSKQLDRVFRGLAFLGRREKNGQFLFGEYGSICHMVCSAVEICVIVFLL